VAQYILTAKAEDDLLNIWRYIAEDNPQAATNLLNTLNKNIILLAENKYIGMARPDIMPELRYFPVGSYLILYRHITSGVEIVRVVHGARNIHALVQLDD
jgi:toxin ParE1/3/4